MIAGVNADQCVLCTLQSANFLGYDCFLIEDCTATTSPDYCMAATLYLLWPLHRCLERMRAGQPVAPEFMERRWRQVRKRCFSHLHSDGLMAATTDRIDRTPPTAKLSSCSRFLQEFERMLTFAPATAWGSWCCR